MLASLVRRGGWLSRRNARRRWRRRRDRRRQEHRCLPVGLQERRGACPATWRVDAPMVTTIDHADAEGSSHRRDTTPTRPSSCSQRHAGRRVDRPGRSRRPATRGASPRTVDTSTSVLEDDCSHIHSIAMTHAKRSLKRMSAEKHGGYCRTTRGSSSAPAPASNRNSPSRSRCWHPPERGGWCTPDDRLRLVEVIGFEPTTPALRTQCSTGLSYTPVRASVAEGSAPTVRTGRPRPGAHGVPTRRADRAGRTRSTDRLASSRSGSGRRRSSAGGSS